MFVLDTLRDLTDRLPLVGGGGYQDDEDYDLPQKAVKAPPALNQALGVRRIAEGHMVDESGKSYCVWRVVGADIDNENVVNGWSNFLNSMEFPVQVLVRQHSPDLGEVRRRLAEARPPVMRSGPIGEVCNSLLEYLEQIEGRGDVVTRRWFLIAPADKLVEAAVLLESSGLGHWQLDEPGLSELLQASASGMGLGHSDDVFQMRELGDCLELGHRSVSVFEYHKWPRRIGPDFFDRLFRLGEEMDLSMWIWPVGQRESHTRLRSQRTRFEGARLEAVHKGKMVSPDVELAIEDATRLSEEVQRGVSRLYRVTITLAVYARTRSELERSRKNVDAFIRSNLGGLRLLRYRQAKGYHAMMPVLRRGPGEMHLTDTGTMLRLFPFGPPDLDKREGALFGLDMRSRTPVIYDAWSSEAINPHMVVMARAGAGKSYLTSLRVLREAQRGVRVYIIDPEGEYSVITQQLGGRVLIPGNPDFGVNPFRVRFARESDLAERIGGLSVLVGLMLEGELDQNRKAIIDRSLSEFYALELQKASERGDRDLGNGGIVDFVNFLKQDDTSGKGAELGHLLEKYATGSSRYLMAGGGADLLAEEPVVTCFNLKNLSAGQKPVATSICAETVWGLGVSDPRPRLMVVDECWTVLQTPSGAEALLQIAKRARKYRLGLMTITQDVDDFLGEHQEGGAVTGHAGRSILQNSSTKLVLSQDPAALPTVVEAVSLNDSAASFLASARRGQGLLLTQWGTFPLEVVATEMEHRLITDRSWLQFGDDEGAVVESDDDVADVAGRLLTSMRQGRDQERTDG